MHKTLANWYNNNRKLWAHHIPEEDRDSKEKTPKGPWSFRKVVQELHRKDISLERDRLAEENGAGDLTTKQKVCKYHARAVTNIIGQFSEAERKNVEDKMEEFQTQPPTKAQRRLVKVHFHDVVLNLL